MRSLSSPLPPSQNMKEINLIRLFGVVLLFGHTESSLRARASVVPSDWEHHAYARNREPPAFSLPLTTLMDIQSRKRECEAVTQRDGFQVEQ